MRGVAARPLSPRPMRAAIALLSPSRVFSSCEPILNAHHGIGSITFPRTPMKTLSRREFLAASTALPLALSSEPAQAAESAKFRLGIVTYNVPKDWDLPTLLKVCREVGIAAVECRTTHKHGVEPSLTANATQGREEAVCRCGRRLLGLRQRLRVPVAPISAVVKKNIEDVQAVSSSWSRTSAATGVKVRPNGLPKGADPKKTLRADRQSALIECGKAAERSGIEIWVEVHGGDHAGPQEHEDHHGRLRAQVGRRDLELERHRRGEQVGRCRRSPC